MNKNIYIDVIFLENLIMNYLILWSTAKLLKERYSKIKLIFASALGAFYAVFMYFPQFDYFYSFFYKIFFSIIIIIVAYTPKKISLFFRIAGVFYLLSFVFGGAAFGLYFIINGLKADNSGVLFIGSFPVIILFISSGISYIFIKYFWSFVHCKIKREKTLVQLIIDFDGDKVFSTALVDTGNSLYEPISKIPVIVVEYDLLKDIMPNNIQSVLNLNTEDLKTITSVISNSKWMSRFRVIPFKSLGKESGLLIGFTPDKVNISYDNKNIVLEKIVIGIYNKKLSNNGEYDSLVHPDILQ